jgi:hypothetical protein
MGGWMLGGLFEWNEKRDLRRRGAVLCSFLFMKNPLRNLVSEGIF